MKLKTYIIPDFKTIEIRSERYCDGAVDGYTVSNRNTGSGGNNNNGGEEEDDAGAAIFRDGIWDEE